MTTSYFDEKPDWEVNDEPEEVEEVEFDTECMIDLICPYCGEKYQDVWELYDDEGTRTCGNCEKEYEYERSVSVYYTTTKL